MNKFILRSIVYILAFVSLFCSITLTSYASSEETFKINPNSNLFENMQNMSPGKSYTETVFLHNDSNKTADFFLKARSAGVEAFGDNRELKDMSDKLLQQLELTLVVYDLSQCNKPIGTGTNIYKGTAAGVSKSDLPSLLNNTIPLARIGAGGCVLIDITVKVPDDLPSNLLGTQGKFIWDFYFVSDVSTVENTENDTKDKTGSLVGDIINNISGITDNVGTIINKSVNSNINNTVINEIDTYSSNNVPKANSYGTPSVKVIDPKINLSLRDKEDGFFIPLNEVEPVALTFFLFALLIILAGKMLKQCSK